MDIKILPLVCMVEKDMFWGLGYVGCGPDKDSDKDFRGLEVWRGW